MDHAIDINHISLILTVAFIGGLIFRILNLPTLMGYVLAGIVIGPSFLNMAGDISTIKFLAELAVVLLMFMIGLELDASRFRSSLKPAITIALSQILLSGLMVSCLGYIFYWSLPLVLTLSFMLALSSTAVAVGSMRSSNMLDTKEGNLAIGILIAQDILVVPMLVIITSLDEGLNIKNIFELGIIIGVILLTLFVIFELVSHPKWVKRLEYLFTIGISQPVIAGVGLCFGSAALFGSIGLSAAYGAFVIGLLLGNIGSVGATYRKAVAPIHDVLVMFFFISIGLMVDIPFVLDRWIEIVVTVSVAILFKLIGTAFLLHFYKFSWPQSLKISGVLGHIGEFAFVLSALAYSNGLLVEKQYLLSITVIALSLLISPILNNLLTRVQTI